MACVTVLHAVHVLARELVGAHAHANARPDEEAKNAKVFGEKLIAEFGWSLGRYNALLLCVGPQRPPLCSRRLSGLAPPVTRRSLVIRHE